MPTAMPVRRLIKATRKRIQTIRRAVEQLPLIAPKILRRPSDTGYAPTSTVGRGKALTLQGSPAVRRYHDGLVSLYFGDALEFYGRWPSPTCIVSDGAYGVLGFEGDTSNHLDVPGWYEPHVEKWSRSATPGTTLWFWNSEIGWAATHPVLEKHGWRYINCNIWNKGVAHIAGNINTQKIRRFPVVTEVCVQYVFDAKVNGLPLKRWIYDEWKRTGLPMRTANRACGVKDAATRKYFDQGHLWYFPPLEPMTKMVEYANRHGTPSGKPYFALDGKRPLTPQQWSQMRTRFNCPHGVTNVWDRNPVNGTERIRADGGSGRAVHLNQKPLDLMTRIIEASTNIGDVVWEPFGGLFSASLAARRCGRRAFSAEIDSTYYQYGVARFANPIGQEACSESRADLPSAHGQPETSGARGTRRKLETP